MTTDTYTCLQCGTARAASACDACVGVRFDPDEDPIYGPAPTPPPPIDEEPRCLNCAGAHPTQRCPEIAQALRATHPGRAIWRHFHTRPRHFIETLRGFDLAIWQVLAASCADFEGKPMTAVLDTWLLAAQGTALPERVREAA